jgi:hypothetical protein
MAASFETRISGIVLFVCKDSAHLMYVLWEVDMSTICP